MARKKKIESRALDTFLDLNEGDLVVHLAHGIGRYRGLVNLDLGQGTDAQGQLLVQEFLHLEYADKATLYVPVSQLHQISRYTGVSPDEAPLHKLGSGQWEKAKRRAAEQAHEAFASARWADSAAELLGDPSIVAVAIEGLNSESLAMAHAAATPKIVSSGTTMAAVVRVSRIAASVSGACKASR